MQNKDGSPLGIDGVKAMRAQLLDLIELAELMLEYGVYLQIFAPLQVQF